MGLRVRLTKEFEKSFSEFDVKMRRRIRNKLALLAIDPMYPSLRSKKIKGRIDIFECSVNMDIRILWRYEGDEVIVAIDVGHHDILKRF